MLEAVESVREVEDLKATLVYQEGTPRRRGDAGAGLVRLGLQLSTDRLFLRVFVASLGSDHSCEI